LYNNDNSRENRLFKIWKITAFLVKASKVKIVSNIDILEIGFTIAILKKGDVEVNIPIPTLIILSTRISIRFYIT
jgi:hypothetical protein